MAETIFLTLSGFFARYGYWVIFFGVMLENAGLPIPGETVLLFAGFLSFQGEMSLWRAMLTGFIGASLGDSIGYGLGRYAGTPFVEKYVGRFLILRRLFERAQTRFRKYGHWAVFVGRFITGLRVFAGPLAGIFRMSYLRFLFFNLSGAAIWALAVVTVGYLFGSSWESLVYFVEAFHRLTLIALAVLILTLAAIYYYRRAKSQKV